MDDDLPIIAIQDAAREKGCHRTTIHRAIERGELNATEFGGRRVVVKDDAWKQWQPTERGGRFQSASQGDD
jgi:excisionase family DNA binding protein